MKDRNNYVSGDRVMKKIFIVGNYTNGDSSNKIQFLITELNIDNMCVDEIIL